MLAATLRLGIDVARDRRPDADALRRNLRRRSGDVGELCRRPGDGEAGTPGAPDRARELMRLHADNGFVRLGEDAEQLTTLIDVRTGRRRARRTGRGATGL